MSCHMGIRFLKTAFPTCTDIIIFELRRVMSSRFPEASYGAASAARQIEGQRTKKAVGPAFGIHFHPHGKIEGGDTEYPTQA